MGRKKRKVAAAEDADATAATDAATTISIPPPPPPPPPVDPRSSKPPPPQPAVAVKIEDTTSNNIIKDDDDGDEKDAATKASHYAMTSHSGEIVEEDTYVSDGSEDVDDVEVILSGSKMGLMRRGLHQPLSLVQPNLRQWTRPDATTTTTITTTTGGGEGEATTTTTTTTDQTEEQQRLKEQEELAKLDPAERAARLLVEKQRKLEEAKESARRIESEENAGRDPCLFSKRTAFDIRFDQIDDKPWERGAGDLTDFFNYSLTVEDWLEYAQQQLTIRQELTDASRQKRPPDPNIVPVAAKKPKSQTPKVAVAGEENVEDGENNSDDETMEDAADAPVIGPAFVKKEASEDANGMKVDEPDKEDDNANKDVYAGSGGAWGAGAAPDSVLARLIEEQTQKENGGGPGPGPQQTQSQTHGDHYGGNRPVDNTYGDASGQYGPAGGGGYDGHSNSGYDNNMNPPEQSHGDWQQRNYQDQGRGDDSYGGGRGGRFGGRGRGGGRGGYNDNSYGNNSYGNSGYGDNNNYGGNNYDANPGYDDGGGRGRGGYGGRGRGRGRGRGGGRGRFDSGRGGRGGGRWDGGGRGRGNHYGGGGY